MANPISDIETRILNSYKLICEYEDKRLTDEPRERSRSKNAIDQQWSLIKEYLEQYRIVCKNTDCPMREEIKQIAAYLPQSLIEDFRQAYDTLKNIVPDSTGALQQLTKVLRELGQQHEHLNEWKEMHNLSQECLTALMPLKSEIESMREDTLRRRANCRGHWGPCRTKLSSLESFATGIKYIDKPFYRDKQGMRGPSWMISITVSRDHLQRLLREDDPPIADVYEEILNLWDVCYNALYQADKRLRDKVGELYMFSNAIIRSIDDGHSR